MPGASTADDQSFDLRFNHGPGKGPTVAASVVTFETNRVVDHAKVDLGLPKVNAIRMEKQDRKQIKGDVSLIHKSEKQALKPRTDNGVLKAVTRMAATKDTTMQEQQQQHRQQQQ